MEIYNQGIKDRIATLETEEKDLSYMTDWFEQHQGRFSVLAAEKEGQVIGWASLNPYSSRCSYNGVADISVYISREFRARGQAGSCFLPSKRKQEKTSSISWFYLLFHLMDWDRVCIRKWGSVK